MIKLLTNILIAIIPISLVVLFAELVLAKGKKTIRDVAVTMLGICYIPLMRIYLTLVRNMNIGNNLSGKF